MFISQWLHTKGVDQIQLLSMGLEAASIVLFIATCPGVDRRAVNEESLEASIALMRMHLKRHLIPAMNQTGHLVGISEQSQQAMSPSKRRRTSEGGTSGASKDLKKVYRGLLSTLHLQILLTERLESLVQSLTLDDSPILTITSGALSALEMDCVSGNVLNSPGQQLQVASISLLTEVYRKYPNQRETIMEDVFPLMLRLPTGKRSLRTLPIRYSSCASPAALAALNVAAVGDLVAKDVSPKHIQMITSLVLSLVQSCVQRPGYENTVVDSSEVITFSNGLQHCQQVSDYFVDQLLKRCAQSKTGGALEFRAVLSHLVEDLLMVFLVPEYPSAEFLLATFTQRLSHDLLQASSSYRTTSAKNTPEASFVTVAFDILGKICAVQARILALNRDRHILVTHTASMKHSSTSPQPCYCGDANFVDSYSVGCVQCKRYFHGECIGIHDNSQLTEVWLCDSCRLGRILVREMTRFREFKGIDKIVDDIHTLKHAFQASLAHRLGVTGIEDATRVHLARWVCEVEKKCRDVYNHAPHKLVSELLECWGHPGPAGEQMTTEGDARLVLAFAAKTSPLIMSFRNQIRFVLKLMSDESSHNLRKLSLKAVEKVRSWLNPMSIDLS